MNVPSKVLGAHSLCCEEALQLVIHHAMHYCGYWSLQCITEAFNARLTLQRHVTATACAEVWEAISSYTPAVCSHAKEGVPVLIF